MYGLCKGMFWPAMPAEAGCDPTFMSDHCCLRLRAGSAAPALPQSRVRCQGGGDAGPAGRAVRVHGAPGGMGKCR